MPENEEMKQRATPCFLFGLVCFSLGGISLTGYFVTPHYDSGSSFDHDEPHYQFSDKEAALPFGIVVMSLGFLVIFAVAVCKC